MAKFNEERMAQAMKFLSEHLLPGTMVYTVLRSVARSGMSRTLSVVMIGEDGPWDITGYVAVVLGENRQKDGSMRVGGCGLDVGMSTVYNLSTVLYRTGFICTGHENCPSNDHANGDLSYTPHLHRDGGYALRHRWI